MSTQKTLRQGLSIVSRQVTAHVTRVIAELNMAPRCGAEKKSMEGQKGHEGQASGLAGHSGEMQEMQRKILLVIMQGAGNYLDQKLSIIGPRT